MFHHIVLELGGFILTLFMLLSGTECDMLTSTVWLPRSMIWKVRLPSTQRNKRMDVPEEHLPSTHAFLSHHLTWSSFNLAKHLFTHLTFLITATAVLHLLPDRFQTKRLVALTTAICIPQSADRQYGHQSRFCIHHRPCRRSNKHA